MDCVENFGLLNHPAQRLQNLLEHGALAPAVLVEMLHMAALRLEILGVERRELAVVPNLADGRQLEARVAAKDVLVAWEALQGELRRLYSNAYISLVHLLQNTLWPLRIGWSEPWFPHGRDYTTR